MKEPVDHILRPRLPWREDTPITECGYDGSKVKTLSRGEYFTRLKDMGQQRSAMLTCMTCAETARRWGTWEDDARKALQREIEWECRYRREERSVRLLDELHAIAELIAMYPVDFANLVGAKERQREWLQKKAAHLSALKKPAGSS